MYRPKVQGMEAVSITRWEGEIPSELLQVVEAQRKESCIVVVDLPVGKGRNQNKQGKLRTSVAVGCAYVPGPKGGESGNCLFVGSRAPVRQREVKKGCPARGTGVDWKRGPLVYCVEEPLAEQGVGTAKEVCGNHCVLGVQLPDEGHSIGDLVRA